MGNNLQLMDHQFMLSELDYIWKDSPIIDAMNNYLQETFCLTYNKGYKLYRYGDIYVLHLNHNNADKPIVVSGEFKSDEAFIDFLIKNMTKRQLFTVEYFELYRTDENGRV